ncbi:MAG: hypothetical protein GY953_37840, partial [bacterium]|nr:hypothetical protein [bacterium]
MNETKKEQEMAEMTEPKRALPGPDTALAKSETDTKTDGNTKKRRSSRRTRSMTDGAGSVRYFLGKPSKGSEAPELARRPHFSETWVRYQAGIGAGGQRFEPPSFAMRMGRWKLARYRE